MSSEAEAEQAMDQLELADKVHIWCPLLGSLLGCLLSLCDPPRSESDGDDDDSPIKANANAQKHFRQLHVP
ncbi:hypothetical protein QJS10_CPB12g01392 [Acorus calamus]|uniref:Uncharacterized protein n=1 Tax=Acorus calamus TaxID=4465 RepID=A0AAV9DMQ9_ACOCL|nr:hypothetical protein QJS10_CPB12g01392 [Acorus calamus]